MVVHRRGDRIGIRVYGTGPRIGGHLLVKAGGGPLAWMDTVSAGDKRTGKSNVAIFGRQFCKKLVLFHIWIGRTHQEHCRPFLGKEVELLANIFTFTLFPGIEVTIRIARIHDPCR